MFYHAVLYFWPWFQIEKPFSFWALLSWATADFWCTQQRSNILHGETQKRPVKAAVHKKSVVFFFLSKVPDIRDVTLRRDSVTWPKAQRHYLSGAEQVKSQDSNMTTATTHQVRASDICRTLTSILYIYSHACHPITLLPLFQLISCLCCLLEETEPQRTWSLLFSNPVILAR